jgi:bifunctional non-homologous end joining protein LigD
MQCKLVDQLPSGKEWLYELKLNGYRALAITVKGRVQLISRNQKDLTRACPEIVNAIAALDLSSGVRGDRCARRKRQTLLPGAPARARTCEPTRPIYYYAFDLLNLEGKATIRLSLREKATAGRSVPS